MSKEALIREYRKPIDMEETLLRFEDNLVFDDAGCVRIGIKMGIWDLPQGPEPGPGMPKKKRLHAF